VTRDEYIEKLLDESWYAYDAEPPRSAFVNALNKAVDYGYVLASSEVAERDAKGLSGR
jgi:hypothetical protein